VRKPALAIQVGLETDNGSYKGAICAYKVLLKVDPAGDEHAAGTIKKIETALANPIALAVPGRIWANPALEGPAFWSHALLRARFHFAEIKGDLKSFRLTCTGATFEAAVDLEMEWNVPAAAGECTVRVEGSPGSTFQLVEEW